MSSENHIDAELLRTLHRYIDGDLSEQEREAIEAELRRRPDVLAEFEQMRRLRATVQNVVESQPVPERLRDSVSTVTGARSGQNRMSRSVPVWGWSAIAACILLAVGFLVWTTLLNDPAESGRKSIAQMKTEEVLAIGVTDHIRCAVTYYKGKTPHYSETQMRKSLGPDFAELLSVVGTGLESGEVVVAHRCSFEGRKYVHMILHQGEEMLSYIITKKREGESYGGASASARMVGSREVYSGSVEGYSVAGFETDSYLVFLASELEPEQNIAVISRLLSGTVAHLQRIST